MKSRLLYLLSSVLIISMLITGCKDDPSSGGKEEEEERGEYFEVNSWIRSAMDTYYFWDSLVPETTDGELSPQTFFDNMLKEDDIFSYMSDDAETLQEELQGSSYTAGFSPAFGAFSNSNNVFIIVEFVYPGAPAEEAGLKRGDIILEINGVALNRQNYLDLYYDDSDATYTLGEYDPEQNSISQGGTITVSKAQLELDPVVYTDIIEKNGAKIGYIFYAQFLNGEEDKFIESLDNTLSDFAASGVTELVVDLRYNPGGRISAAKNFANSIAPLSAVSNEDVFVRYQYNEELEEYYITQEGMDSPNLVEKFSEDPTNLNLNRTYFLTTSGSASASELLMIGLEPYMEVIGIGEATFGKFYGSFVLTGQNVRPFNSYNYALVPVTLKYANAVGYTDFRDGLIPDHEVEEDLFQPKAIGDTTDVLLAKAIQLITGEDEPAAKAQVRIPYQKLDDPVRLKRGNVMFEKLKTPQPQ